MNQIDPRNGVLPPGIKPRAPRAQTKRVIIPRGVTPPPGYERRVEGRS